MRNWPVPDYHREVEIGAKRAHHAVWLVRQTYLFSPSLVLVLQQSIHRRKGYENPGKIDSYAPGFPFSRTVEIWVD